MADTQTDNDSPTDSDRRLEARVDPVRTAHHDAVYTLARASHMHDSATGDHVVRIRLIVECVALEMGMPALDAESLGYDAMLHDVGKLMVPTELLQKPTPLTESEAAIMRSHTVLGAHLLADRSTMQQAAAIAESHHERTDGSGYPAGLKGDEIPLPARITAVADVFDALLSERPYKPAWPYEKAIAEVSDLAGKKLDQTVVDALQRCHERGELLQFLQA